MFEYPDKEFWQKDGSSVRQPEKAGPESQAGEERMSGQTASSSWSNSRDFKPNPEPAASFFVQVQYSSCY